MLLFLPCARMLPEELADNTGFLLLAFLAYNIFHAFFALNLKAELRRGRTMAFWVQLIAAEIHALPRFCATPAPP